tara:strand:- start:145 stop:1113 length:969 start_codon:yes stop_codon:yes gene_type:complete
MIDTESFFNHPVFQEHKNWLDDLKNELFLQQKKTSHGDQEKWETAIESLPKIKKRIAKLNQRCISIDNLDLSSKKKEKIIRSLKLLNPWRKGPFSIDGTVIDSEWKSYIKWERVKSMIGPLNNKRVLDVGCGNGYYSLRMIGDGADFALGIDPSPLFIKQFEAISHFMEPEAVLLLPLKLENIPDNDEIFDVVFSMGVLYHQRSYLDHLLKLNKLTKPGGELVLETLVLPGRLSFENKSKQRYSQMKNVWHLPNVNELSEWLNLSGFNKIKIGAINKTSTSEQRSTEWMTTHSLINGLNPINHDLTIEGLPAPHRIVIVCIK